MLYTNLNHIENAEEFTRVIGENENVVVICGRMGPLCIPVYRLVEEMEGQYSHVKFYDMEYDNPESFFFQALPEVQDLDEIPFIVFYKNGKAVKTAAGLQSRSQIAKNLDKEFAMAVNS